MPIGYWESETLLKPVDLTIIGAGIVGMSTALHVRRARRTGPSALSSESLSAGAPPQCGIRLFWWGGEWLDDLESLGPEGLKALVRQRAEGLRALIELLGAEAIGLQWTGGPTSGEDDADQRAALAPVLPCRNSTSSFNPFCRPPWAHSPTCLLQRPP